MCSRGSVIPLFVEQIKKNLPITITDPKMTRFLMSLDEAVELVLFAFENAEPADMFIQKSPASTVGDLATALLELFHAQNPIKFIGTRHGEKLYETLLTTEEKIRACDMGDYYRVPMDARSLNYEKYIEEGDTKLETVEPYTSHNTRLLSVEEIKSKLLEIPYIQEELRQF